MKCRVASVQTAPEKGRVRENLDAIVQAIQQCSDVGIDLVTFAETATSGYLLESAVLENSLTPADLAAEIHARTQGIKHPIDAIVGFYENENGKLYNSLAYLEIQPGQVTLKKVYRKFFLASYGVFDDDRFVNRGTELGIVDTRFGKVGLLICEDVWHSILGTLLAKAGAQLIVIASASPGRGFSGEGIGNHDRYQRMVCAVAEEHGVFCVNTQLCGFEGGKGFIGGSIIVDPHGTVINRSPILEPHILTAELDFQLNEIARSQLPLIADLESSWAQIRSIIDRMD